MTPIPAAKNALSIFVVLVGWPATDGFHIHVRIFVAICELKKK
jgi:hypothetical protein